MLAQSPDLAKVIEIGLQVDGPTAIIGLCTLFLLERLIAYRPDDSTDFHAWCLKQRGLA
jgi:hypothetical protein